MASSKTQQQSYEQLLQVHKTHVSRIATQVLKFKESNTAFRIYHGSTNSTRPTVRDPSTSIDVSALKNVLRIDVDRKLAIVEPNVPMDALVRACLPFGLVPPVIPEFPGITVGGGFAGTAGESSSFRHGFLDATVRKIELITANGQVVEASSTSSEEEQGENVDLFYGAAGTLGTLGVLTRLDISLIPAKSHVELTYTPVSSFTDAVNEIISAIERTMAPNSVDGIRDEFIECIMFSSTKGSILTGKMVDLDTIRAQEKEHNVKSKDQMPVVRFSRRWDNWYYLHVQKRISSIKPVPKTLSKSSSADEKLAQSSESSSPPSPKPELETVPEKQSKSPVPSPGQKKDLIPLEDYLFRYDRGGFWVGRLAFTYFKVPFNRILRAILDRHMHTRVMYHALHASGLHNKYIVEDLAVPLSSSERSDPTPAISLLNYINDDLKIFPLWVCPLRLHAMGLIPAHIEPHSVMLNIGVWGPVPSGATFESSNRDIERKVAELGGTKWLYAHTFYTEDEFWNIYDKQKYEAVREKWGANYLPSVWDKVRNKDSSSSSSPEAPVDKTTVEKKRLREKIKNFWVFPGLYGLVKTMSSREYILKKS